MITGKDIEDMWYDNNTFYCRIESTEGGGVSLCTYRKLADGGFDKHVQMVSKDMAAIYRAYDILKASVPDNYKVVWYNTLDGPLTKE